MLCCRERSRNLQAVTAQQAGRALWRRCLRSPAGAQRLIAAAQGSRRAVVSLRHLEWGCSHLKSSTNNQPEAAAPLPGCPAGRELSAIALEGFTEGSWSDPCPRSAPLGSSIPQAPAQPIPLFPVGLTTAAREWPPGGGGVSPAPALTSCI